MLLFGLVGMFCRSWTAASIALIIVAILQLVLVVAAERFIENGGLAGMAYDWVLTGGIVFLTSALRQAFGRSIDE